MPASSELPLIQTRTYKGAYDVMTRVNIKIASYAGDIKCATETFDLVIIESALSITIPRVRTLLTLFMTEEPTLILRSDYDLRA